MRPPLEWPISTGEFSPANAANFCTKSTKSSTAQGSGGSSLPPNPGRSGATTRQRAFRWSIIRRYVSAGAPQPCRSRTSGPSPSSMYRTRRPSIVVSTRFISLARFFARRTARLDSIPFSGGHFRNFRWHFSKVVLHHSAARPESLPTFLGGAIEKCSRISPKRHYIIGRV